MHLVDETTGETLATDVEVADGVLSRARGLMFRPEPPEALYFAFGRTAPRSLHMLFVPFPIDAVFLVDGTVERVTRLSAWTGLARARADAIVELPAGGADGVSEGDQVRLHGAGGY